MNQLFSSFVEQVKSENRYRDFLTIDKTNDSPIIAKYKNKEVIVWCSNDYLCMSKNSHVKQAAINAINNYGTGAGGTRNISGSNSLVDELESLVAKLHNKESGMVFTSGFITNQSVLSSIIKIIPDIFIFSDQCNHASIIDGLKFSKNKAIFKHNNVKDLEEKIKITSSEQEIKHKIIVVESVYSMNGNICDLNGVVEIAKKYGALIYLDEVHGVGLYGKNGGGISQELGLESEIDIIQGTFGKAFGCIGGYISSSKNIVSAIRSVARGFIFSTSLPPMVLAANIKSVSHLINSETERTEMKKNVELLKSKLKIAGIDILDNNSHIIPVMVRDPVKAKMVSKTLLEEYNIYIQHINYPTVPKGSERLRITVSNLHTVDMIDDLVDKLSLFLK